MLKLLLIMLSRYCLRPLGGIKTCFGHTTIVELLLKLGVLVNARNQQGTSAQDYAYEQGHEDIEQLLSNYVFLND